MIKQIVILFTLWMLACTDMKTGTSISLVEQSIRNGTRAPEAVELTDGQILALGWLHPAGSASRNFCTATLVSPRIVATAKHCVDDRELSEIGFGMGLQPTNPRASVRAELIYSHPQLDAAILILSEDATLRLPEVEPIPFNRIELSRDLVGTPVQAGGYGETYDRSRFGRYFATVYVSGLNRTEIIVDGRGEQGICFGDSGGPIIANIGESGPSVLGVESWGDPSCLGVDHLIRLDTIADWIDSVSEDAMRPPDSQCIDLPEHGVCDGERLQRCDSGRYIEIDCDAQGLECRAADGSNRVGCFEIDVCANVGSIGVCEDNKVIRCRFGDILIDDCTERDLVCRRDRGGAFCTEDESDASISELDAFDATVGGGDPDAGLENQMGSSTDESDVDMGQEPLSKSENAGSSGCVTVPRRTTPSDLVFSVLLMLAVFSGKTGRKKNVTM
ncbi:MAG: S1 family peptidase [Myxococcota bacterium]|nr:S1 family peptidase [Myxococcota bacterium]